MKKIILIYLLTSIFLFSNITEKYINIIQKNEIFTCDIKEKVIPLIGENFTGMYYKGRPYGLWELKNKKVRQCFLSNERKYYYEVTGVSVVNENTELYQLPNNSEDKQIFINKFKASSKNWLSDTKISGDDNMAVFATCRLDNVYLRSLVLARQIPDSELKNFLEKYKDLLNS